MAPETPRPQQAPPCSQCENFVSPGAVAYTTAIQRRQFLKQLCVGTSISASLSIIELMQPKTSLEEMNAYPSPTLEEVLQLLQKEFPDSTLQYRTTNHTTTQSVSNSIPVKKASTIQPDTISEIAERTYYHNWPPTKELSNVQGQLPDPIDYAKNYNLSKEEAKSLPREQLDCNDLSNWVCEYLHEHHVPVYTISVWAQSTERGFSHWHIFAVCKVHTEKYLIIDNATRITVWEGSLADFIRQYDSDNNDDKKIDVRFVPRGISRYVPPKHTNAFSKFLVQIRNTIENEHAMQCIGGEEPAPIGAIADENLLAPKKPTS